MVGTWNRVVGVVLLAGILIYPLGTDVLTQGTEGSPVSRVPEPWQLRFTDPERAQAAYAASLAGKVDALAEMLSARGETGAAERLAREAIAVTPDEPLLHVRLARLQFRDGNSTAARQSAAAVLARDPLHTGALEIEGAVLLSEGHPERALVLLEPIVRRGSEEQGAARLMAGLCHLLIGDSKAAEDLFAAYVDGVGDGPAVRIRVAQAYESAADREGVVEAYERAAALDPEYPFVDANLAYAYLARSRDGDVERAMTAFDKHLARHPADASAWRQRGEASQRLGHHEDAVASFERALAVDPGGAGARLGLGISSFELGRHADAIGALTEYLQSTPARSSATDRQRAHYLIGRALNALGRRQESLRAMGAAKDLSTAATLQVSVAPALSGPPLRWLLDPIHPASDSIALRAELRRGIADAALHIGLLRRSAGAPSSAAIALEAAGKWNPLLPRIYEQLGTGLVEQGHVERGIEALEIAVALDIAGNSCSVLTSAYRRGGRMADAVRVERSCRSPR